MEAYKDLDPSAVAHRLAEAENPLFIMHRRPDGDTVGSAAALAHLCRALGKTVYGLCADKIPERLAFLTESFSVGTTLPSVPVTPIAVDVASPAQLGASHEILTAAGLTPFMMIDHHAVGEPFADHLIVPSAAAAGEVVFDIAEALVKEGYLSSIPSEAACAMYAALSSDTGCFRYSNVTPKTLRTAALLLESPLVDAADINHRLFEIKSDGQLRAEAFAIEHTDTSHDGKIAWVTITQRDKEKLRVEEEHLETVIDVVRSRAGVEIAVAIRETPTGEYRASMRSNGFDVASVAAVFGGGGHMRAAGCTVRAHTADEALSAILDEIKRQL
jgi:phosphoesterase RecJ-like protein